MKRRLTETIAPRKRNVSEAACEVGAQAGTLCFFTSVLLLFGCAQSTKQVQLTKPLQSTKPPAAMPESRSVGCLRLIGEQRLPLNYQFDRTTVGGLSGIDYDPRSGDWIVESDDRSEIDPARFYVARLDYDAQVFRNVTLTAVRFFKQADGSNYPGFADAAKKGGEVPDIEDIRFDPIDGSVWYSSEGLRRLGLGPFVKHAGLDGRYIGTLPVAPMFYISTDREWGPRDNLSFEGISFSPDGKTLWVGMETALYQDGPVAGASHGATARFTKYARNGAVLAQYAYRTEPITHSSLGKLADNGVSDILAINANQLLVLERSGVQNAAGVFEYFVRLYKADAQGASNIKGIASLVSTDHVPVAKVLVLDFDQVGLKRVDNLEGIAWGPHLANGHDSLVLVSDNNFDPSQVTQFLAFEVMPESSGKAGCP